MTDTVSYWSSTCFRNWLSSRIFLASSPVVKRNFQVYECLFLKKIKRTVVNLNFSNGSSIWKLWSSKTLESKVNTKKMVDSERVCDYLKSFENCLKWLISTWSRRFGRAKGRSGAIFTWTILSRIFSRTWKGLHESDLTRTKQYPTAIAVAVCRLLLDLVLGFHFWLYHPFGNALTRISTFSKFDVLRWRLILSNHIRPMQV